MNATPNQVYGASRQREISDALHAQLLWHHTELTRATRALQMVANRTVFGTSWREQECLGNIKCRQRFRYPGRHEQACSNDTLRFRTLVDLRCQHPCEAAFFHRIESCFQPLYPLLNFARDKGFGVLVERRGFFASELEHLFWRSWHPTSVLLKYDDRSRHGMAWNKCWKSPVRHNRTADLCFNVEQGAVLVMASRKGAKRQVVPPADPTAGALRQAVPPAVPTVTSLMMQSDLVKLGIYQPSRRASDIPIVVVIQRQGGSRTFLNFSSILLQLSRDIQPATVIVYSGDESLKETIRLYASASVIVGYHGAAFANVLFSKPRTLAIEIFTRPCGSKYLGFNYRMANGSGLQWRTLFVGTPYANAQSPTPLDVHGMSVCKPAFVSLKAEDIHTVGRCIREELGIEEPILEIEEQ